MLLLHLFKVLSFDIGTAFRIDSLLGVKPPFEFLDFELIVLLLQHIVVPCQFAILLLVGGKLFLKLGVFFFRFPVNPLHLLLLI